MNFSVPVQSTLLFILVFARTGSLLMVLPMIGERIVPVRIRLVFAVFLTVIMMSLVRSAFLPLTGNVNAVFGWLIVELVIGIAIGMAIRFLLAAADMASQLISQSLGLSLGETFDPSFNAQSPVLGTMLTLLLIVMMFEANVHHALIAAIVGSYLAIPPGVIFPLGDFSQFGIKMAAQSLVATLQISAPFILFGIVFNLGLGLLSRLVPQLQVMFLATPLSIMAGIALLTILLSGMMERLSHDVSSAFLALGGG